VYKSSAAAEMDDRLATIDMGLKVAGCCAPFWRGAESLSNTMSPGSLDKFMRGQESYKFYDSRSFAMPFRIGINEPAYKSEL